MIAQKLELIPDSTVKILTWGKQKAFFSDISCFPQSTSYYVSFCCASFVICVKFECELVKTFSIIIFFSFLFRTDYLFDFLLQTVLVNRKTV